MTTQQAESAAIWLILMEECGADPDTESPFGIWQQFVHLWPCGEFRFVGKLGHGGKVRQPMSIVNRGEWTHFGQVYVDCYPEDATPERKAMIERANTRLQESVPWHKED
jgi:hypothetical protein